MTLHPYLLAPTPTGVTLAWEAPAGRTYRVYSSEAAHSGEPRLVTAFVPHTDGDGGIYSIVLKGTCTDGTLPYVIEEKQVPAVSGAGGRGTNAPEAWHEVAVGQAHLPRQVSEEAHYLLLSDSHAFNIHTDIARVIEEADPDLIIHGGDLPAGTGFQREQYTRCWFAPFAEVLSERPVIYAPGNHDDGPHFNTYFSQQSRPWHHDATGRSFSFTDSVGAHWVIVDSNPWGLTEMNAVNSGVALTNEQRDLIDTTLSWLRQDLESEEAQQATWRIVVMHHPYTDTFTNAYCAELCERTGVDLVLAGHLHEYFSTAPLAPALHSPTPRPLYLTLPSCQDAAAGLTTADGQRLMSDFPEVLSRGQGNYAHLTLTPESLTVTLMGFVEEHGNLTPHEVDRIELYRGVTPQPLTASHVHLTPTHDSILLTTTLSHAGPSLAIACLTLRDNDHAVRLTRVGTDPATDHLASLRPGESKRLTFRYQPPQDGRTHEITCADATLTWHAPEATSLTCDSATITFHPDGDRIEASVDLRNLSGSGRGSGVELRDGDRLLARQDAELEPHCSATIRLLGALTDGGEHEISLHHHGREIARKHVDAGSGLAVIPRVPDRSGWGHDALLRGRPRWERTTEGYALDLLDDGDYLEVPPSPTLPCTNDFAGSVRAKVRRLARPDEMAHSPLMVRGLSVGWGATYHLRMVIDRNGVMKWGTCYDACEYAWAGSRAPIDTWCTYGIDYAPTTGGSGTLDSTQAAHVEAASANLRDASDLPIFVGYSYIGHVQEPIGRPKYYTHLPATVSEVRYALREEGAEARTERLHLDFNKIEAAGTFTSEWRSTRAYASTYLRDHDLWTPVVARYRASIPAGCQAIVRIEASTDRLVTRPVAELSLTDGAGEVPLPPVQAQWFRLVCTLEGKAELGQRIEVPRLNALSIDMQQGDLTGRIRWATNTDWSRGRYEGAIGLEPLDRLHVFEEFTDPIHG